MSIETEHRGYKVHYAENQDVWRCWSLEVDAPTLSGVKRKIDKHDKARRTPTETIPALLISYSGGIEPVSICMMADAPKAEKYGGQMGKVWVYTQPGQSKARSKVELDKLVALAHPDAPARLQAYRDAVEARKAATAIEAEALKAIPRFTYEALAALLPMSDK